MFVTARRVTTEPIIHPGMPGWIRELGENVNGPSLIATPGWLPRRLGKYYLYFAHHRGDHIRLAYADRLGGPWTLYQGGALRLAETAFDHHIASPDIHVDEANRRVLMYFHGKRRDTADAFRQGRISPQQTVLAVSRDGLSFVADAMVLEAAYFRRFDFQERVYGVAMHGDSTRVLREVSAAGRFEPGPHLIPRSRHTAAVTHDGRLIVVYSRVGDNPEHIRAASFLLDADWFHRSSLEPLDDVELLRPEFDWEGAGLPAVRSERGATHRANQLRDPAIYREGDSYYLIYTVAGESGLALAELDLDSDPAGAS